MAEFELGGGAGFDLQVGDKIKLTRARACYTGGSLIGILFYVLSIKKKKSTKTVEISAILDTQMY